MTDDHNSPSSPAQSAAASQESPAEVKVVLTRLRITLGILAIIIGIGSGIIMSSATLFK